MQKALEGWTGPPPEETDIRRIVLSYALLAPSPHNIQPWSVELSQELRIHLFIDPRRLLPECDPRYRQVFISHGCFLENLEIAASHFGFRTDIQYFPGGWPASDLVLESPVATIDLISENGVETDPLFSSIVARQSNKRPFRDKELGDDKVTLLAESFDQSYIPLGVSSSVEFRTKVAQFVTRAMEIEMSDQGRLSETLALFRFSESEIETYRDGFGIAQSGIDGVSRFLAEHLFLSREKASAPDSGFAKEALALTRKQAETAPAFGWISTKGDTRLDQIRAGRAYERVHLAATGLGLAMQPFSQILESYPGMASLSSEFSEFLGISESHTLQMLFRVGYADPVAHSPRRALDDLLRTREPAA